MSSAIQSSLKQTISSLENKSKEVGEADFNTSISADRVKAAQSRIGIAESKAEAQKTKLSDIDAQLNPPPTKDISEGGKSGGTKTVVDQDEVKRLNSEKELINTQLAQAKSEVEEARQEADQSSNKALADAGIKEEVIQELGTLQSRVSSMQEALEKGEKVSDEDVAKLAEDIGKFTNQFKKEDNKGDLLGNAIYDPLAKGLKDIAKLLERGSTAAPASTGAPEGTVNKELEKLGIVGEKQEKIVDFMVDLSEIGEKLKKGETFTKEQMQKVYNDYKDVTKDLTPAQAESKIFVDLKKNVEDAVKTSGHEDILPVTGSGGAST